MSDSELAQSLLASFLSFLSSEWTKDRLPYNFLSSVRAARSAPSHDTSRIFLDCGFQAWTAYFIVKPGKANASGQTAQRQRFAALDSESFEARRDLANRVAAERPHPTVAKLIESMEQVARTSEQSVAVPSKRPCTEDHSTGREFLVSPLYANERPQDLPTHHDASHTDAVPAQAKHDITSGADIEGLALFPEYLRGAIRRDDAGDGKTAAVSMNFPPDIIADVDCAMTMEILPNKVERLAILLFDAHLEMNGKVRELVLPGGITAIAYRLQGGRPGPVSDVFGAETVAAIESAPYRRYEVSEGTIATRCVSMSDFVDADKGAIITLTLGMREASQIFEKLFKSKLHSRYVECSRVQQ
ncbi:hypothetical protein HIM_11235 [Hirsutella minnesotensis 3608]|uniref:Uncharacterized protein n=1 Tax=Hirsutella minnesotensis 3608 TaxID=1043627 RepID=A0A0F8A1F1_9HYPO|nr:hypothetical protein HIM_11235 [Hirsutella minnesotensis 3608]